VALKEQIQAEVKKAMLEKNSVGVLVLRMLLAAILNKEKEKRTKLSRDEKDIAKLEQLSRLNDEEILGVISSEAKKRNDSIEQFARGGRNDLVEKEKKELEFLTKYLPEQMPEDEIKKIVKDKIQELNISGKSEIGKLMGAIMPRLKGKADGVAVNKIVLEELK